MDLVVCQSWATTRGNRPSAATVYILFDIYMSVLRWGARDRLTRRLHLLAAHSRRGAAAVHRALPARTNFPAQAMT